MEWVMVNTVREVELVEMPKEEICMTKECFSCNNPFWPLTEITTGLGLSR